jgi:hypothetical protein
MKRGHVTGTKRETQGSQDWYRQHEAAHLARIEAQEDATRALTTALAKQVGNAVAAMPEAAERIAKAARVVQAGEVWPLESGNFLVASQSTSPVAYLVTRGIGWGCECHDYQHRTPKCKHILAAMLTVKLGALYQANYTMPAAA